MSEREPRCVVDDMPVRICGGPHVSHECEGGIVTTRYDNDMPCPFCGAPAVTESLSQSADEIERLRAVMTQAADEIESVHRRDPRTEGRKRGLCEMCGGADGGWPCVTRTVADDLTEAMKGTTDDR